MTNIFTNTNLNLVLPAKKRIGYLCCIKRKDFTMDMLKKPLFITLLILSAFSARSQHVGDIPLMTKTWELIADRTYKLNTKKVWAASFPAALKSLENKVLEFPGYMIPVKAGMTHSMFMLSVLPTDQCQFCGEGDIPAMIEVHSNKPVRYSDKPIKIKGKLVLNETGDYRSELFLLDAALVK